MSSYINFFIKKDNHYCLLESFSRSTEIYQQFENYNCPYDQLALLTNNVISFIKRETKEKIRGRENDIAEQEKIKNQISSFNNSVDDKISAIYTLNEAIADIKDSIINLNNTIFFLEMLSDIIDEYNYQEVWYGIEAYPEEAEENK